MLQIIQGFFFGFRPSHLLLRVLYSATFCNMIDIPKAYKVLLEMKTFKPDGAERSLNSQFWHSKCYVNIFCWVQFNFLIFITTLPGVFNSALCTLEFLIPTPLKSALLRFD